MSSSTDVVREYFAACEAKDISVVDRLFDAGFVSRSADGATSGINAQRANLQSFFDEFDRLELEVHETLESGDRVVTRYTHHATIRQTGERVAWDRIVIHRVVDGRIVEAVGVSDSQRLALARERARLSHSTAPDGEDLGALPDRPRPAIPGSVPDDATVERSCSYPALDEPYATALRDAVAYIAKRFPTVTAIAACGTIVRGTPDPSSDLDLYVIHAEPWFQRVQRRFQGVPAEIFVNPEFQVYRYLASQSDDGRPITAHMLATGFPVFDPDGVLLRLRSEAERVLDAGPPPPHDRVRPKYLIASVYEDATDVAGSDPRTARLLAHRAVRESLEQAFRRAGRFIPRPKEILSRLAELDPDLHRLAVAFIDEPDHQRAVEAAGLILDRVVGVRGLFEWESTPQWVDPPDPGDRGST